MRLKACMQPKRDGQSARRWITRFCFREPGSGFLSKPYVMPYGSSTARNGLLPAYLWNYNGRRCHMALGGLTPKQRLAQLQA